MLTQEALAFSELGRLWREFALNFADTITDNEVLSLVRQGLQRGVSGRITKLVNITQDDDGTFKGEFQQYVNPRLTKRFSFTFGENQVTFKPINEDEIEQFSEGDDGIEDFARASKSGRANKSLNCKIEQCGGRCLRKGDTGGCKLDSTPEQKKLWKAASGKNLATKPETSLAKKRKESAEARKIKTPALDKTGKFITDLKTMGKRLEKGLQGLEKPSGNVTSLEAQKTKKKIKEVLEKKPGDSKTTAKPKSENPSNVASLENQRKKKAEEKKEETSAGSKKSKPKDDSPQAKIHSVKKQEDFEDLAMHVYGKLAKNKGDDLVPIYKIRREIGELVPRDKFNDWFKQMQSKDKLQLLEGSVEDSAPDKIKDSVSTKVSGIRGYARLGEKGQQALDKANTRSQDLEKTLKNRPDLDPIGTASQLREGPKIKSQSDFDKVTNEAHKRLDDEFNHGNLVPISDVRKAMGDRVSKDEFDKYLKEAQANDKVQLVGGDNVPDDVKKGGVKTMLGGERYFIKKL